MDNFGDIVYILAIALFSIIGAISKKRKKAGAPQPNKVKDIFETLFEAEGPVDDPVQQQMAYEEFETEPQFFEASEEPVVEAEADTFAEMVDKRRSDNESVLDESKVAVMSHKPKVHPLLDGFKSRTEVQKAVLYAEILKPKF